MERRRRAAVRAGLRRRRTRAGHGLLGSGGRSPSFGAGCAAVGAHHRAGVVRVPAVFRDAWNPTRTRPLPDAVRCGAGGAGGRGDRRALLAGEFRSICRHPRPVDHDRWAPIHDRRRHAREVLRADPTGRGAGGSRDSSAVVCTRWSRRSLPAPTRPWSHDSISPRPRASSHPAGYFACVMTSSVFLPSAPERLQRLRSKVICSNDEHQARSGIGNVNDLRIPPSLRLT
jgi:hypothetical protein